jgi:monoamine oxidase
MTDSNHVVIVDGGFAGLGCARKLAKRDDIQVTLASGPTVVRCWTHRGWTGKGNHPFRMMRSHHGVVKLRGWSSVAG